MAYANGHKSSAELEREVAAQRNQVEARIGEIKSRLSPGQLVDELLSYTKDGGNKFAGNLGDQVTANPIPAALVGVGLIWLIAASGKASEPHVTYAEPRHDFEDYPYARTTKGLRRVSHATDESGEWWSEFETDAGERYRAPSDTLGRRAGHFVDSTGKKFAGFIDDTGNRVRDFRDDAGNLLEDASNWASHSWQDAQRGVSQGMHGVASAAAQAGDGIVSAAAHARHGLAAGTRQLGGTMQQQTDQLSRQITDLFEQQPLIAGALAFAAGAALGAALPHTGEEDRLIGKQGDQVRRKVGEQAGELYRQGKEKAAELYDEATDKAGRLYEDTKENVANLGSSPSVPGLRH